VTPNPYLQDELYAIVGDEVARNEFHPGPMARAVSESQGNRELVQGLYIKFRVEELYRKAEREAAAQAAGLGAIPCPRCGHVGRPIRKPRGNLLLLVALFLLYIIPGLLYAVAFSGYKGVCAKCRSKLIDRMT